MKTLQELMNEAGIRNFSVAGDSRILSPVKRREPGVIEPPEELRPNIIPPLRCAQIIRDALGMPVTIVSGYRTLEYNRLVGSEDTSKHPRAEALDLAVARVHYRLLKDVSRAVMDALDLAGWGTGWGCYDNRFFVHIDAQPLGGPKRRW